MVNVSFKIVFEKSNLFVIAQNVLDCPVVSHIRFMWKQIYILVVYNTTNECTFLYLIFLRSSNISLLLHRQY